LQLGVGEVGPLADAAAVVVAEDTDVDVTGADGVLADGGGRPVGGGEELHVAGGEGGAGGGSLGGRDETGALGDAAHHPGVAEENRAGAHGGPGARQSEITTPPFYAVCRRSLPSQMPFRIRPPSLAEEGAGKRNAARSDSNGNVPMTLLLSARVAADGCRWW